MGDDMLLSAANSQDNNDDIGNNDIDIPHYSSTSDNNLLDVFPSQKSKVLSLFTTQKKKREQKVVNLSPAAFISFPIQKPIIDSVNSCKEPDFVTKAFSRTSSFHVDDFIQTLEQTSITIKDESVYTQTNDATTRQQEQSPQSHQSPQPHQPPQTLPKSDPVKLVLARLRFLLSHEKEALPAYHVFTSNSECIAVWCKTGRWSTLQASIFLHSTAVGNAKQTVLAIGSVAAINPLLIPAIAPLGLVYIGAPVLYWYKCRDTWEKITLSLNDKFWSICDNDVFVTVIQEWTYGINTANNTNTTNTTNTANTIASETSTSAVKKIISL